MKNKIIQKIKDGTSFKSKAFDLFRNDKEVIFEALKVDSRAFQYASHELKDDPDFVRKVITRTHDSFNLIFVSDRLRNHKQFLMTVDGLSFAYPFLSKKLQYDKDIAMKVIEKRGFAIHQFPSELKNDRDIVYAAVKNFALSYIFVPLKYRKEKELIELAVQSNIDFGRIYKKLPANYKKDRNLIKEALKANGQNYYEISKHLEMDRELLLAAIESKTPFPWVLKCASDEIKKDKEFVLKFLKIEWRVVVHASDEIRAICHGLDPVEALEKAINAEKLSINLANSLSTSQFSKKAKLKI